MMENKKFSVLRYTLHPSQIMTFVSGLHNTQSDMIEELIVRKEREGFPEANAVINHIRSLK